MRFALLGSHPDGLAMASALVESGRHQLAAYTTVLSDDLRRWGGDARAVRDLEEVLADPAIDAVLVAGSPDNRPAQLRRALQSERHVLCVYPPDRTPEAAYEAAMIQNDTGYVLLPLLPEALHPGMARLAELVRASSKENGLLSPIGSLRLLEIERAAVGEVLIDGEAAQKPSLPGWDVLRRIGGEIAEVSAFASQEELVEGEPLLVAGRFQSGALFQESLLPHQPESRWRLTVIGSRGRAELNFPLGWEGPAYLDCRDEAGEPCEEYWDHWDPWPALVEDFELAVEKRTPVQALAIPSASDEYTEEPQPLGSGSSENRSPQWQDAVRGLELDDAARRSVERRRTSPLEYPEASEEVGFKGTMTLVGCGILWGTMLLLILSRWVPQMGWIIVPLLVLFLGLQILRYVVPDKRDP